MPFVFWNKQDLGLGVESMDDQHQTLIKLMNQIFDANEANAPKAVLISHLNKLVDFTLMHFKEEEEYMAAIGFEGLESHKYIHKQLVERLSQHFDAFRSGPDTKVPEAVFLFLKVWLTAHIMGIDMRYAKHDASRHVG